MRIYKEFTFEAAHFLPTASETSANRRIHGHSFRARVTVEGSPDRETGVIVDLGTIEAVLVSVKEKLDHHFLNEDVEGLALPTLENIALWIWSEIETELPDIFEVAVMRESCNEGCVYRGSQHKKND